MASLGLGVLGNVYQTHSEHKAAKQQVIYERRAAQEQALDYERYANMLARRSLEDQDDLRREKRQALASLTASMAARGTGFQDAIYRAHERAYDRGQARLARAASDEIGSYRSRAASVRELGARLPGPSSGAYAASLLSIAAQGLGGLNADRNR